MVTHPPVLAGDGGVALDGGAFDGVAMPARLRALGADPAALLVVRTDFGGAALAEVGPQRRSCGWGSWVCSISIQCWGR